VSFELFAQYAGLCNGTVSVRPFVRLSVPLQQQRSIFDTARSQATAARRSAANAGSIMFTDRVHGAAQTDVRASLWVLRVDVNVKEKFLTWLE